MSLASMASPWTNDDISPKKRASSMRKTIKIRPANTGTTNEEEYVSTEPMQDMLPTVDDLQIENQKKTNRVNELINQMSSVEASNDGDKLADFRPPPQPTINIKKDLQNRFMKADEAIDHFENSLQLPVPMLKKESVNPYSINNSNTVSSNMYSNYQHIYNKPAGGNKPYYANMGVASNHSNNDSKLMQKLNYMIHLLENQENEKTENMTEELILYTFLGVFIIFVLDSFARTGKYVR